MWALCAHRQVFEACYLDLEVYLRTNVLVSVILLYYTFFFKFLFCLSAYLTCFRDDTGSGVCVLLV